MSWIGATVTMGTTTGGTAAKSAAYNYWCTGEPATPKRPHKPDRYCEGRCSECGELNASGGAGECTPDPGWRARSDAEVASDMADIDKSARWWEEGRRELAELKPEPAPAPFAALMGGCWNGRTGF